MSQPALSVVFLVMNNLFLILRISLPALLLSSSLPAAQDWPQFRGPTGQGIVDEGTSLPLRWSATQNIAWRSTVPGRGWSSPVVHDGRIYLTSAVAAGDDQDAPVSVDRTLQTFCLDASTGEILWSTTIFEQRGDNPVRIHKKNSHASPTPVIAYDHLFVHFGHQGTACLTLAGEIVWKNRDLSYTPVHGNGGSPIVYRDRLIFSCDGPPDPFVAALHVRTGKVLWKTPRRTEARKKFSFSTPLVIDDGNGGEPELILPGSGNLHAYDPMTGRERWRSNWGEGYSVVPRPVFGHGLVFASSGYDQPVLYAVRPGGQGDVTDTHIAWTHTSKGVPRNSSFVLVGNELYTVDDKGIGSCFDAKTGEVHWQERLLSDTSASLLASGDRIYATDETGQTVVYAAGREYRELARNQLGERTLASAAVVGSDLLIRTESDLFRISE